VRKGGLRSRFDKLATYVSITGAPDDARTCARVDKLHICPNALYLDNFQEALGMLMSASELKIIDAIGWISSFPPTRPHVA